MCQVVCNGECATSASTGPVEAGSAIARALWWLARNAVAPALLVAAVLSYRWLSGAPMIPKARPLHRPAWLARIRWHAWPRWQRAVVRCLATAVTVSAVLHPLATALTLAAAAATFGGTVVARRRHQFRRAGPVRVQTVVAQPGRASIEADPIPAAALTAGNYIRSKAQA